MERKIYPSDISQEQFEVIREINRAIDRHHCIEPHTRQVAQGDDIVAVALRPYI